MARPKMFKEIKEFQLRISVQDYNMIKDLAAYESSYMGKKVTVQDLIRIAIHYTFTDNERLREAFRRVRECCLGKYYKKLAANK